jgi:hypothetical protein
MKQTSLLTLGSLFLISLTGCKPPDNTAAEEARRQLEQTQAAYAQEAADMKQRSEDLQKQLAEMQRALQDKENAELKGKLDAIQQENQKLMADAEAARRKSEELRDELARTPVVTTPYVPPQVPGSQPWNDPNADYSMFYDSLNPYGRWMDVDGYGYAFRPDNAERSSWRPYVDGRWVSTDQGWAWDSNEPFGWATYHYGRWIKVSRHGWLWIPGRQWAPAWVSWRHGSDYVGWAPLPPSAGFGSIGHDCDARYGLSPSSYTFISASNFGRSSYVNVSLSISNIASFFNQTINVTNIVVVQQNNTCIQRGGPALDWSAPSSSAVTAASPASSPRRFPPAAPTANPSCHATPSASRNPSCLMPGRTCPTTSAANSAMPSSSNRSVRSPSQCLPSHLAHPNPSPSSHDSLEIAPPSLSQAVIAATANGLKCPSSKSPRMRRTKPNSPAVPLKPGCRKPRQIVKGR